MNIQYLRSLLFDYKDQLICEFLEFGFPIEFTGDMSMFENFDKKSLWKMKNHKGAEKFASNMRTYLQKESFNKAIIGPFKENPFKSGIKISPVNSLPKKDTSERRVILDLSFPKGKSVNDFISKDFYLGEQVELIYPKVDDFIQIIKQKGQGCLLFKTDLRRAYRQLHTCPSSYNLVAFVWKKHIFCDTVLSMGSRASAFCCQRFTNALVFIMFKYGISVLNYLDDLASAEKKHNAWFAYMLLQSVLEDCGIEEAKSKACPPSTCMSFLGVLFNTITMTMEITPERLKELISLLKIWLSKEKATLKQIQSLLGKLNFVSACVRPGRIFVSRMLKWLKVLYKEDMGLNPIPEYVKKDILWWYRFLPQYNGVSLMVYEEWSKPDSIVSSDACLTGCGGFWKGHYFHTKFPTFLSEQKLSINVLEMYSILICLRLWGKSLVGQKIQMFCDNEAVCQIINSGRTYNDVLQSCLREITFLAAKLEFQIKVVHISGVNNRIADSLSRWELDSCHKSNFKELTKEIKLKECQVTEDMFLITNNW